MDIVIHNNMETVPFSSLAIGELFIREYDCYNSPKADRLCWKTDAVKWSALRNSTLSHFYCGKKEDFMCVRVSIKRIEVNRK